jgi:hypothetical protein
MQSEEERKQAGQMQELVERLQTKLRNYKRQIEEAEEIAALNLAKFRKTQVRPGNRVLRFMQVF